MCSKRDTTNCITIIAILFSVQAVYSQVEFRQHLITDDFIRGISVFCADVDGDDDMDLLGTARGQNEVSWWENEGDMRFIRHIIIEDFIGAGDVLAIDMDQDGDMDVIGTATFSNTITWWENNGAQEYSAHIITEEFIYAATVTAGDLDGDGDIDILGGGELGITWWENDGDQNFRRRVILENLGRLYDIYLEDIDGDDDVDIVAPFFDRNTVSWVENQGDGDFEEHVIGHRNSGVFAVHAADLDDDGDMDVITGAYSGSVLCWYENNGEQDFERHVVIEELTNIWDVFAADIDIDRDVDILCSAYGADVLVWAENEGDGNFDVRNIVENFDGATGVYAADMDLDGDKDVIGTAYGDGEIRLWENLCPTFRVIVEPDTLDFGPVIIEIERIMNLEVIHQAADRVNEEIMLEFQVSEGGDWLQVEPREAVIPLDDTLDVEVSVFPGEGEELGTCTGMITIIPEGIQGRSVDVPVLTFIVEGFGSLGGVVIDAATDEVMPGISVELEGIPLQVETDDEGVYLFENLPAWTYSTVVEVESYLPYRSGAFEIGADQDVELNIDLLHALCESDLDSICVDLVPDRITEIELFLFNEGTGPVRFWIERRFPGLGDVEPWDMRATIDAAEQTGDDRLQGVEFDGNHFYVTGGNNGEGCGLVHVFSREGEHLGSFNQFRDSQWGIRGLAWDGELLWGGDDEIIYGFTPEGELREQFVGPLEINRSMTWDEEHGRLWICDVSSDLLGIDRAGNLLDRVELISELHIYGLGTFPEDSAGYTIYTFNKDGEFDTQVNKINLDTGDQQFVADIETRDEHKAGGSCLTGFWDPMSWVLAGVLQGRAGVGDAVCVCHINSNRLWLVSEPDSGIIAPDGSTVVDVTINSEGFATGAELSGELVITHNGRGEQLTVPVRLQVVREDAVDPTPGASDLPVVCTLVDPYPNPFNSSAVINYSVPSPQLVSLSVWDINGRKVADLVHGLHKAGLHRVLWEGSELSTGTYIVHLEAGESVQSMKLVHIK